MIDSLAIKMKEFQEQWYQIIKTEEEEPQQLIEIYHDKQHKILIDVVANKLKVFQEQWYQRSNQEGKKNKQFRETYHNKQHKIVMPWTGHGAWKY